MAGLGVSAPTRNGKWHQHMRVGTHPDTATGAELQEGWALPPIEPKQHQRHRVDTHGALVPFPARHELRFGVDVVPQMPDMKEGTAPASRKQALNMALAVTRP